MLLGGFPLQSLTRKKSRQHRDSTLLLINIHPENCLELLRFPNGTMILFGCRFFSCLRFKSRRWRIQFISLYETEIPNEKPFRIHFFIKRISDLIFYLFSHFCPAHNNDNRNRNSSCVCKLNGVGLVFYFHQKCFTLFENNRIFSQYNFVNGQMNQIAFLRKRKIYQ